jgi:hypothetical protein
MSVLGFSRGATFSGVNPGLSACFQYQLEGSRAFAMASASDLMSGSSSWRLKQVAERLEGLTELALPPTPWNSFVLGHVQKGDVLFVPAGMVVVEKALNEHNIILRCNEFIVSHRSLMDMQQLSGLLLENPLTEALLSYGNSYWPDSVALADAPEEPEIEVNEDSDMLHLALAGDKSPEEAFIHDEALDTRLGEFENRVAASPCEPLSPLTP